MAYAPEPSMDPDPKKVFVGITIEKGKLRVVPERVRLYLGQSIQWVLLAFDGREPVSLQIYFDEASPFRWRDQRMDVVPPDYRNPSRSDWTEEQPTITAAPEKPGDFKYGVRMRDRYDQIVDDDDPYITVLSRL